MRVGLHPLEILASLAGGAVAGLFIVMILGHFSPGSQPVHATLVNCAAVRARSRQDSGAPVTELQARAERKCAQLDEGAAATPSASPTHVAGVSAPQPGATTKTRTHGWRKAATPRAS